MKVPIEISEKSPEIFKKIRKPLEYQFVLKGFQIPQGNLQKSLKRFLRNRRRDIWNPFEVFFRNFL